MEAIDFDKIADEIAKAEKLESEIHDNKDN